MEKHYLDSVFQPETVAVFAGKHKQPKSQSSLARLLVAGLTAQRFSGKLVFLDIQTSGTLADLTQTRADLAIIALPATEAMDALEMAGRIKCKAALVLGQGTSAAQATDMQRIARRHGMYLLGPNSLGFQRPRIGLNASIAGKLANTGHLGLVSQSGSLTTAILDWAQANAVGFSTVVSLGPHTDVDMAQVLDYLACDAQTHSIVVYMEDITDARRFMSALRAAASAKPVVVLKAGRKPTDHAAAQTHSGAIVGNDAVFDAALRRAGAVRVRSFVQLFSATKCLASRYGREGKRLAVVTNGGGPGVLAADWASEIGLELAPLTTEAAHELQRHLAPLASLGVLMDLSAEATPEHYRMAVETAGKDRTIDGILVIFSPKADTDAAALAKAMADLNPKLGKPLLCCWMGDSSVGPARHVLTQASIPSFRTPEAAVGAFGNIASYYQNQQLLHQTPPPLSTLVAPDIEGARLIIENVLTERRQVLSELESKALLSAFHIPVTQTVLARSATEAMMIASQLGYPVALKIDSPDISHKSDVDGVALNVMNATSVNDIYHTMMQNVTRQQPKARINGITIQKMARRKRGRELYIGVKNEAPFGPVIAFGAGGTMIELMNDLAIELPPLNQFLARHLIQRSRVAATLGEWRGASAINQAALEQILLRVSEMVCELPQLREIDINPIIADAMGAVAVDARIVIGAAPPSTKHYQHLSILPYPASYEQVWPLPGGGEYTIRPIRPDDADMLQQLVRGLSSESRYFRFFSAASELQPQLLSRLTLIDYDSAMGLVAVYKVRQFDAEGEPIDTERIIGESRYTTNPNKQSCEFALVVANDFNGKGVGTRLMMSIMEEARDKGLSEIQGVVMANNPGMLKLMRKLEFSIKPDEDDPACKLVAHAL